MIFTYRMIALLAIKMNGSMLENQFESTDNKLIDFVRKTKVFHQGLW
jgi:hypothetical protein